MKSVGFLSIKRIAKRRKSLNYRDETPPSANYYPQTSEAVRDDIPRVTSREVRRGELSSLFRKAPAAILQGDDRIYRLVDSTFNWLGLGEANAGEKSPFHSNIFDLARNHGRGNVRVGDMLRFMPRVFGHIARKFVVFRGTEGVLQVWPEAFHSQNRLVPVPREIMELAWNLMSEVLVSVLPSGAAGRNYAVEVDVLVYASSSSDVSRMHSLLADSTGAWSKLGERIDAAKDGAAGFFQSKGVRDAFALTSVIPGIGRILWALNDRMSVVSDTTTPKDHKVIASAHVDETRYITGLMGFRSKLVTEISSQGRWKPLPVTRTSMALFPSARIVSVSNIVPTRHRVLVHDTPNREIDSGRNVTVSVAVVDPIRAVLPPGYFREIFGKRAN